MNKYYSLTIQRGCNKKECSSLRHEKRMKKMTKKRASNFEELGRLLINKSASNGFFIDPFTVLRVWAQTQTQTQKQRNEKHRTRFPESKTLQGALRNGKRAS